MKVALNISIRRRIYLSFLLFVFLFVVNGILTIHTLNSNKELSMHLTGVVDPSLQSMDDFRKLMVESKMYTTNWVFLRSGEMDKALLKRLHNSDYSALKSRINIYSSQWEDKKWVDSLNSVFARFEMLLSIEKSIMGSLKSFSDYNDPVSKLEAERKVEEEILPRTAAVLNALNNIYTFGLRLRAEENQKLEKSSMQLRMLIIILAITMTCAGIILSMYMTRVIIRPINRIRSIVNDLGKGITRQISQKQKTDEIGKMVESINNLSKKLQTTATFAYEVGLRNFDMPFRPLSDEDTLGKSLIAMRNNLRMSEQELVDAHTEIQTIFNASLDAVIIIDEEGKIVKWDSKAENLFGWKEDEVMGMSLTETIIPVRYREAHQNGMKHFLKTRKGAILGKTVEVQALKKNNDEFDISLSVSPSLIKDKYRFIGFIRDITSRKSAEAELRRSEERYRQIVETSQEGIWLIDENNKTNFVNKRLCEILGYSSGEMMGKEIFYFMDDEGKKNAESSIEKRKQGINESYNFKYITKEGEVVWTYLATSSVLDVDGKYIGALAMVTDITQRKLNEELLQQSKVDLAVKNRELNQKNKELEQFAYVASHDLQEPIRTTTSFVELLLQEYKGKLDERGNKYLSYIAQASDRMRVLINDLLEYSRIGKKRQLEKVDCNIMMHQVLADLGVAIKEAEAEITFDTLPVIEGFPTEIKQLFQNLIMNAIKFRAKKITPKIKITAQKNSDYWEFAIVDNGIGIAKEHNERIFVIFQRLHNRNEYNGSGIGLSHCRKIVELHKGKIWVESTPGSGSTFHFTIHQNNNL